MAVAIPARSLFRRFLSAWEFRAFSKSSVVGAPGSDGLRMCSLLPCAMRSCFAFIFIQAGFGSAHWISFLSVCEMGNDAVARRAATGSLIVCLVRIGICAVAHPNASRPSFLYGACRGGAGPNTPGFSAGRRTASGCHCRFPFKLSLLIFHAVIAPLTWPPGSQRSWRLRSLT